MPTIDTRLKAVERSLEREDSRREVLCPSCSGGRVKYALVGPADHAPGGERCVSCGREVPVLGVVDPFHPDVPLSRGPGHAQVT